MMQTQTSLIKTRLQGLRGFAFDLDGTIWEGPQLLPGAIELVGALRAASLAVVFVSNCSRSGSPALCRQLAELGIVTTAQDRQRFANFG